jgi:hypothetical protein
MPLMSRKLGQHLTQTNLAAGLREVVGHQPVDGFARQPKSNEHVRVVAAGRVSRQPSDMPRDFPVSIEFLLVSTLLGRWTARKFRVHVFLSE